MCRTKYLGQQTCCGHAIHTHCSASKIIVHSVINGLVCSDKIVMCEQKSKTKSKTVTWHTRGFFLGGGGGGGGIRKHSVPAIHKILVRSFAEGFFVFF